MTVNATIKALVPVFICATCESPSVESPVTVRDSAGVEIVESQRPRWSDGESWRLSSEPILEIGVAEGENPYVLDRVTDAVRLADGTVVVAHAADNTLRYFDKTGLYLRSVGGEGGGPEEFSERITGLRRLGDSVLIWQFALQPSKVFDREGNFVRAYRAPLRPSRIDGVFADGSHLFGLRVGSVRPQADLYLDSSYVYVSTPDFAAVDSIARLPAWYAVAIKLDGRIMAYAEQVYGAKRVVAAGEDEWYYGWPETYEFWVLNRSANVRRIVRRAWEPLPVTDADRQRYRESILGPEPEKALANVRLRAHVESMAFPDNYPAFQRIEPDPSRNVWVQQPAPGWFTQPFAFNAVPPGPTTWDVFNPSGAWLGSVRLPSRFEVFDIGDNYVLGLWKDESDVERVRVYDLIKPHL